MFIHYRTQGIVVNKEDRGEFDQLFTIYTKDFGKLEILGKAIRKIGSKLRQGVEIFYFSEIEFIEGKRQKTLTDAILLDKFPGIRTDLTKLKIANEVSRSFDGLVVGQETDENVWQLLLDTFRRLDRLRLTTYNFQLVYYHFFWKLVCALGYQPELKPETVWILKTIIENNFDSLIKLKIDNKSLDELKSISEKCEKSLFF